MSSDEHQPEYLEPQQGDVLTREPVAPRSRKPLLIGAGVVAGVVGLGAAAWGVYNFVSTGPQPASALPASTIAYVSVDLDPAGSQKVDAYRFAKKFPAIADEVSLDSDDDLRQTLFDALQADGGCSDVDYASEVEPWLGSRAAVAAVDLGEENPTPVAVLQITDADKAQEGLQRLADCATGATDPAPGDSDTGGAGSDTGGWVIEGDWAVFATSEADARQVVADAARGTLADDSDFTSWMDRVGESGIVTFYAAPEAGEALLDQAGPLLSMGSSLSASSGSAIGSSSGESFSSDDFQAEFDKACKDPMSKKCDRFMQEWTESEVPATDPTVEPTPTTVPDDVRDVLSDFQGAAAVLGFHDGTLQLSFAGDTGLGLETASGSGAGDLAEALPADSTLVLSMAFADDFAQQLLDQAAEITGDEPEKLIADAEETLGISLPEDLQALVGDQAALVVGGDFDVDELNDLADPADLPMGVVVRGDTSGVEAVLDKIRAQAGAGETEDWLASQASGDRIAIGPNQGLRGLLVADGDLGSAEAYRAVVADQDASSVLYVNFDTAGDWLVQLADDDVEAARNLRPLQAFGFSAWRDDDVMHGVVRLSTD